MSSPECERACTINRHAHLVGPLPVVMIFRIAAVVIGPRVGLSMPKLSMPKRCAGILSIR